MTEAVLVQISSILTEVLKAKGVERSSFAPADGLYEDGLGIDSLDAATVAAMLDNAFGSDPYNAGEFPQTVGEIISFYTVAKAN